MKSNIAIGNLLTRITYLFILLLALTAGTFCQTTPASDAHTVLTSTNGHFGSNQFLTVSANNTAYVRFVIAGTLPAGAKGDDVASANVRFYINKVATAGKLDLHPILGEWDETTITANNAPQIGPSALTTQQIEKRAEGNYVLIDVTGLVKQWLGDETGQNALPNYGFALTPHPVDPDTPELADISFDSKENTQTSHDGVLSIRLAESGAGLQSVTTDVTLVGDGTTSNPLGVAPGAITGSYLADGAVTSGKIVDGAVTSGKIADGAVGTAKLADNSVGTTKIVDGSVSSAKIAVPLSLAGASPNFTLSVANAGSGPALTAQGAINTSTQYNIGGARILSNLGSDNIFAGEDAGRDSSTLVGGQNAFFGRSAGRHTTNGHGNSFFGMSAGQQNTGGSGNSFFGTGSGINNTTGGSNSFVGIAAGRNNTTGVENAFFGISTGWGNQTGNGNTFIGSYADFTPGSVNTTGNNNILLGAYSDLSPNISNATAIGWRALVTQSNSLVLGSISGVNFGTDTNVGIGTPAPKTKLHLARGRIYVESNGQGLIMKSPNGSCFELTVSDAGLLTILATTCP
jgi:hypothetical protein